MRVLHSSCAIAATILVCASAESQSRSVVVPGAPACTGCSIELIKVATVGKADDPVLFVNYSALYRVPRGNILAMNTIGSNPAVMLYDSAGKFLRMVGRQGQGPGEFSSWAFFLGITRGDSVFFHDRGGRYHLFTASLEFGRSVPYSGLFAVGRLALRNGTFIVVNQARRNEPYLHFAQIVDLEGKSVRQFGVPESGESAECLPCTGRHYTAAAEGGDVWVVRRNKYEIQRYSNAGDLNFTLTVQNSPWMQGWTADPPGPFTDIQQIVAAPRNRLWVRGRVPAQGATAFLRANTASWPTSLEANHSTVLELIDVATGLVVASRRFEKEYYTFLDADHVYRQKQDANGIVSFDVFRVQVLER